MGYHAAALGERELGQGKAFIDSLIQSAPFPLLAANVSDAETGKRLTPTYEMFEVGGRSVGVIGLVMLASPTQVDTAEFRIEDPIQWARQLVPEVRRQSDYVLVLSHLGWGGSFALAQQVEGIDIIVAGHGSHQTREPQRVGSTLLVQAGNKGRRVGVLRIKGSIQKGKYEGELVGLSKSMPEDAEVKEIAKEYQRRIRAIYSADSERNRVAPRVVQIRQKYAGAQSCRSCHMEIFDRWLDTKHANAMAALEQKGMEFDPECVRCHSTGFRKSSGFISMKRTPRLANVQCEQCHGAGHLHLLYRQKGEAAVASLGPVSVERAKNYGKVRITACLECHTVERDDDFSYEEGDLTGIH